MFPKEKETIQMYVVENKVFNVLMDLETVTDYVKERKKIKHSLLDRLVDVLGRSFRRAKKVAAVIDEITYKATDRGFSFNGRETLANKVGVSLSTVDRAIKLLKESGRVVVAYRENPNSNGIKTPVIIFKDHANYKRISSLLKLTDKVDDKVEKKENTYETSYSEAKKVSTIRYQKQENYIYIYNSPKLEDIVEYVSLKISDAMKKSGKGITYLSSYVDKVIHNEEKKAYLQAKKSYQRRLKARREQISTIDAPGLDWLEKGIQASATKKQAPLKHMN